MMAVVDDPFDDQTDEQISAFLASLAAGDEVAIRNPHASVLQFRITIVEEIGTGSRSRFLYTKDAGDWGGRAWLRKTGKNGRAPTGQTSLAIPTAAVRQFIIDHPGGAFNFRSRKAEAKRAAFKSSLQRDP